MVKVIRAFSYPLRPTASQMAVLERWLTWCRRLYNGALEERISKACGLVLDRDHNAALNILALGSSVVEDRRREVQAQTEALKGAVPTFTTSFFPRDDP